MKLAPDQELVRQKLIERVKTADALGDMLVTYGEAADWLGSSVNARNIGNVVLDFISIAEHDVGRPMLSAIVVNAQTSRPGPRFFDTARFLEVMKEDQDEESFWFGELRRVLVAHG